MKIATLEVRGLYIHAAQTETAERKQHRKINMVHYLVSPSQMLNLIPRHSRTVMSPLALLHQQAAANLLEQQNERKIKNATSCQVPHVNYT